MKKLINNVFLKGSKYGFIKALIRFIKQDKKKITEVLEEKQEYKFVIHSKYYDYTIITITRAFKK